jgi:hypothetical protein
LVLGILGGVFGLGGGIFASNIVGLGVSALFASIVGIGGAAYVLKNAKLGGIILIISAIWLFISIYLFGLPGAVFLGLAGLLAIFRK